MGIPFSVYFRSVHIFLFTVMVAGFISFAFATDTFASGGGGGGGSIERLFERVRKQQHYRKRKTVRRGYRSRYRSGRKVRRKKIRRVRRAPVRSYPVTPAYRQPASLPPGVPLYSPGTTPYPVVPVYRQPAMAAPTATPPAPYSPVAPGKRHLSPQTLGTPFYSFETPENSLLPKKIIAREASQYVPPRRMDMTPEELAEFTRPPELQAGEVLVKDLPWAKNPDDPAGRSVLIKYNGRWHYHPFYPKHGVVMPAKTYADHIEAEKKPRGPIADTKTRPPLKPPPTIPPNFKPPPPSVVRLPPDEIARRKTEAERLEAKKEEDRIKAILTDRLRGLKDQDRNRLVKDLLKRNPRPGETVIRAVPPASNRTYIGPARKAYPTSGASRNARNRPPLLLRDFQASPWGGTGHEDMDVLIDLAGHAGNALPGNIARYGGDLLTIMSIGANGMDVGQSTNEAELRKASGKYRRGALQAIGALAGAEAAGAAVAVLAVPSGGWAVVILPAAKLLGSVVGGWTAGVYYDATKDTNVVEMTSDFFTSQQENNVDSHAISLN